MGEVDINISVCASDEPTSWTVTPDAWTNGLGDFLSLKITTKVNVKSADDNSKDVVVAIGLDQNYVIPYSGKVKLPWDGLHSQLAHWTVEYTLVRKAHSVSHSVRVRQQNLSSSWWDYVWDFPSVPDPHPHFALYRTP
jgi:hypothetical protein